MKQNYTLTPQKQGLKNLVFKTNTLIAFLLLLFGVQLNFAQTSNCNNNLGGELTVGTSCTPVTFNSANDTYYWTGATGCNSSGIRDDAWGWFDATSTSTTITYNSTNDAILHLFTGGCSATMTALACSDNGSTGNETITYATTIGTRYRVRIQRYNSDDTMNGTICVYNATPSGSYCTPAMTTPSATGDYISNVTFAGINNTTGDTASDYTYYNPTPAANVTAGTSYPISLLAGGTSSTYAQQFGVWIDYNQNGVFTDTGEFVFATTTANFSPTASTGTISIPAISASVLAGTTRMRVGSRFNTAVAASNSCFGGSTYGEYEDYNIIITAPCVTPTAQPTALVLTPSTGTISGSFTAASPAPNNYLVVRNTTGVAPSPANGTSYTIGGTLGVGNIIVDNDSNTSFTATGLAATTTYYFFIYSFNAACTGGPIYRTTTPLTGNATTSISYCVPTGTLGVYPITNVTFAGINNSNTGAGLYYQDFTAITGNVTGGTTYNISVTATATAVPSNVFYQYAFFDWNNNGVFTDAGETYLIGTYTAPTATLNRNIQIPVSAYVGTIRMRVGNSFNRILSPCATEGYFQMEDYSLNITAAPACTIPTTQPTVLVLTPGATSIAGSFTAAGAPTPQNYLVVMNTTGTAPTGLIANGTAYTIGTSIGVGNTVIDTDSNTTFTAGGLNTTSTYYFYIYSMNALCTGGPLYNTNPTVLIGNATTVGVPTGPCIPSTAAPRNADKYISRVAFIGTRVETNNTSTYSTSTPGYQDFTALPTKAVQAQGEGVNMIVESLGGRTRLHAWVDWNKNGTFESSEMVYGPATAGISSTFGFIVPSGAVPGDYRIRVRTYNSGSTLATENFGLNFDACQPFTTLSGEPQYGEAEDYLFTVIQRCDANIVSVTEGQVCNSGTVTLSATGTAGTTNYRWYASASGGAQLPGSPTTGSWTTPSISTTTTYYVTAWNGTCESLVRTPVVANVNTTPTLTFTPSAPETCGENNIISITATGDKELSTLLFENFESGGLGAFTNVNSDPSPANVKNDTRWTNRSSTFVPTVGISWKPAISSGLAPNNFALATSDSGTAPETLVENSLISGTLNSTGYLNLTMTMKFYYSRYFPDGTTTADEFVSIQISQTGGAPWTTLQTFTADTGIGTKFADLTYNLNGYINQTNLRIRILHHSLGSTTGWLPDGVAVDDIKIFGEVPLGTSFNWTSVLPVDAYQDALCTVPYISGSPAVMVYIKPTLAQLELTTYSFTASALLSNGCSASNLVSINNKSKVWKGGTNGDWSVANNWLPVGVPDATNCVIIPPATNNALVSGTNVNGYGKTLQVINGGNLRINPSNTVTITDFVEVRGATSVFDIENNASLIQINDVVNSGNINYKRIAPGIRGLDYVYWSSPVANQNLSTLYSSPVSGPKYVWNTTVPNSNNSIGNWENASGIMQTAKGYIIRGSSSYGMPATNIAASFTGIPHNGSLRFTIARGDYIGTDYLGTNGIEITNLNDNFNLIGNPYPSAIDAKDFLLFNTYHATTNPTGQIYGNVRLWRHGSAPAAIINPFYGSFTYNYTADDYVTVNLLGASDPISTSEIIKTGQAFFVLMVDGSASTGEVTFNNAMRLKSGGPHDNGSFFRTPSSATETDFPSETAEKHRIWLDLIDQNNSASGTLIGYATGALDGFDTFNDARSSVPNFMKIYSLLDNDVYDIQGKSVPFNQQDQVPLGITTVQAGTYKIGLNTIDGLFLESTQNIYLEDKTTQVIHNLKTSPYSFTSALGTFHDRFVLRYTNETLGTNDLLLDEASVWVFSAHHLTVKSSKNEIQSVRVFDLLGRALAYYPNANSMEVPLTTIQQTDSGLIIQVTLSNGAVVTKKTIY